MADLDLQAVRSGGGVIVAGGSGGIGAAICQTLAAAGHDVVLTYHRNRERAEAVAQAVRALGRRADIGKVDLGDEAEVKAFIDGSAGGHGAIAAAIYAAGPYINMRHISELESSLFRQTLSIDVFGCYHFLRSALPHLRRSRGVIAAVVTPAIRRYAVKDVLSAAPKAAIEALVRGIAAEEGRFGIRANCVGVGVIEDGMYHELLAKGDFDERFLEASKRNVALRRLGSAQDIAEAVAFLVSDRAAYITGQTLMVDGGYAL